MASACAGLSCMTSRRGRMLVPLLFPIEVAVKLFRAGRTDFQTDLGLPKGRRRFEDVVASNNPAAKTWVNGVSQDCTCSLGCS